MQSTALQVAAMVSQRDQSTELGDAFVTTAATGINVPEDEVLYVCDGTDVTLRYLEQHARVVARQSKGGVLVPLPFIVYNWAIDQQLDRPPELKTDFRFSPFSLDETGRNLANIKQLVLWMFKSIRYDAAVFEEFTLAFFSLAWGRRGRDTLGTLFPCLQCPGKGNLRLEPLTRVTFADALLSNTDADGTLTAANVPEPIDLSSSCAILFYGTNNKDQPGFDILIHQPRTDSAEAILLVIECKHTDSVTGEDLDKKVQLAAEELAPYVKGTFVSLAMRTCW